MGEVSEVFLKLTLKDGNIIDAKGMDSKGEWVDGKEVKDLREVRIRGLHGIGVSQHSPQCVVIPVKTPSGTIYIIICPPM